ncbi:MAG TPA: TIM barrel protein [Chryseosolibacter sp.]|jgi:sugar phosphate isomerase/epimerase|nr:TIM barrel protein [Chryseosolibacter sp.]
MNRRAFIAHTSQAAMTLPFLKRSSLIDGVRMGIVVHSYGYRWQSKARSAKYPGFTSAIDLIEHCHKLGAGGVQVGVRDWSPDFSKKVRALLERSGMYLEGSVSLPKNPGDADRFEQDVKSARDAGAKVIRTVCLNGRRYENFHSSEDFVAFRKNAIASLRLAEPVVARNKMKLAVENHKDWRADELATILKDLSSGWVGVTLDFGNSIALMEDPMAVANTLAPYIFSTHVKDMGVRDYADGFLLSEVPLGKGFLDLKKIVAICKEHNPDVNFNLEMITRDPLKIPCLTDDYWATFPQVSGRMLADALRMVRDNAYKTPLPELSPLEPERQLGVEEKNIIECLEYSKSNQLIN